MRFHSGAQARELRRRHAGFVFVYGVMIAVFVAIPLVNLLTPLFADDADGAAAQADRAGGLRPRRRPATSPFGDRAISRR